MREITRTVNGLRITIDNPLERQTVIVEELSRNILIKCIIHTTNMSYTVLVNDGHLSDLISALQEVQKKRSESGTSLQKGG